jgi:hypothetical protein
MTNNETPANITVTCDNCGHAHVGEYSHEGQWGQGPIFVVYCTDGLADYYTSEAAH